MTQPKLKVLYVGEEDISKIIRIFLESKGFEVVSVFDGQKGIDLARSKQPDVVILDELTPNVDGFKVYNIMRDDSVLQELPIIFLESGLMPKDWPAWEASKSTLIRAPIDFAQLIKAIEWATKSREETGGNFIREIGNEEKNALAKIIH